MEENMENNNTNNYGLPSPPPEAHYTVYKLTDPEGKVYIGCTGNPVEKRWGNGWQYHKNSPIHKAIRTIGWKNFKKEILYEKLTKEGGSKLEKWFIAYYDSGNPEKGYNRALGGFGKGVRMSDAAKKANSETILRKYEEDPDYRVRVGQGVHAAFVNDPGYRERVSEGLIKTYENNPGLRERARERVLKYALFTHLNVFDNIAFGLNLKTPEQLGVSTKKEKKEEIRLRMQEYLSHPENRAFAECDRRPKPVVCVETGEVYSSGCEAERITGFYGIHKACSGIQVTSGGYHWRFA